MEQLAQVLNIPLLQAIGAILIIGLAERIGIPVIDGLKAIMKLGDNKEVKRLSSYYNHDLTDKLDKLIELETDEKKERADERQERQDLRDLMKENLAIMREIKEYGIRCRDK